MSKAVWVGFAGACALVESAGDIGHHSAQDIVQNNAQNNAQNTVQNNVQNTVQNNAQNTVQNNVQNTVQNNAQNIVQNRVQTQNDHGAPTKDQALQSHGTFLPTAFFGNAMPHEEGTVNTPPRTQACGDGDSTTACPHNALPKLAIPKPAPQKLSSEVTFPKKSDESPGWPSLPMHPQMEKLERLIKHYTDQLNKGAQDILVKPFSVRMGYKHPKVQQLAKRLWQWGYLEPCHQNLQQVTQPLLDALVVFNKAHGLSQKAELTADTCQKLSTPLKRLLHKAVLNLKRWQKQCPFSSRHVVVNIPGFQALGFKDGKMAWQSAVIVGKPKKRTPELTATVRSLITHPSWVVPPSLARNLMGNIGYKGYTLQGGRLVQKPGKNNALGSVKFPLEGTDGILIHHTNKPSLFKKKNKALSSGCIRIQDYHKLMEHFLEDAQDIRWADHSLSKKKTQSISLKQPQKVHVLYTTLWMDEKNRPILFPDIYGLDQKSQDLGAHNAYPQTLHDQDDEEDNGDNEEKEEKNDNDDNGDNDEEGDE